MKGDILTLGKEASAEFTEKRSVFIGYAMPVKTEDEARAFISSVKKKHSDARHNVSAYVLSGGIMHSSDDGEPSGTAGVPVLEVIRKSGVVNAAVVVTRYFGGILLGAGGLVRAYSAAAKLAIEAAGIVEYVSFQRCRLTCSYSDYNDVIYRLDAVGARVEDSEFSADVTIVFSVLCERCDEMKKSLSARFEGRYEPELIETFLDKR